MFNEIVYFSTLATCIPLGSIYKKIDTIKLKRQFGAGIGVIISILLCGQHIPHTMAIVWINTLIIKFCDRRYIHQVSLAYTWVHILYLHIHLANASCYVILIHQLIALRLVGLAFEMNNHHVVTPKAPTDHTGSEDDDIYLDPPTEEIVAYALCFIGFHKGPYYCFRMYKDYMKDSLHNLDAEFREITIYKLKELFFCVLLYTLLRMKYTTEVFYDSTIYSYDAETRYLYNVPLLLMFFLENVIIMLLISCVCTESGFGVYPAKALAAPDHPTTSHTIIKHSDQGLYQEFDYLILKCHDAEKLLIGPMMKDTLQSWNAPVRYWFVTYIHKNLLKARKDIGTGCSFILWSLWRGPSLQHVIIASTLWFYLHLEAEYAELFSKAGQMKLPWDIGFSIMRLFCLIYLTPCFLINEASTIMRYYNSIFWVFHVLLLVFLFGAAALQRSSHW